MATGEFRLLVLVREMLQMLGAGDSVAEHVEDLQRHIGNTPATLDNISFPSKSHVEQIADKTHNRKAFIAKYDELKLKNVDSLGAFVEFIHHLSYDHRTKEFLGRTAKKVILPGLKDEMRVEHLPEVKYKLKSATTTALVASASSVSDKSVIKPTSIRSTSATSLHPLGSTPSMSSWVQRRPSMSWDFSLSSVSLSTLSGSISSIPPNSQESIIIDDLLNLLMGLPSNYIEVKELRDKYGDREFELSDAIEAGSRDLITQILPLASYYSIVQRFVEEKMQFEYGQANNALAEYVGRLVRDYLMFCTQLETEMLNGNLNLHKVWFYVQKSMHSMGIVSNIATTINKSDSIGGKVLSLLHDKIASYVGDPKAQKLCIHMMEAASVPYMKMLGMWIYKGIIADPIHEFLVEDNEIVQKEDMPVDYSADYWDKKYTIRRERIPKFLEPVSDIILRAGKYLNVIRQCGKSHDTKCQLIEYSTDPRQYLDAIQQAYNVASRTLLDLVIKEQDLLGRLRSVKHYFLLDQGDFIVTFLTLCEKELSKPVGDVIQARLDSLLDLALRITSATNDPYKDDLRTELLPYDLQYQMFKILMAQQERPSKSLLTVIESFAFSYEVRWPLSLILDRKSVARYQMIFRHLLHCKYVERMICQVWRANKVANKFQLGAAKQYRNAFALRQRMLHCVQNLEYHMMVEVIEPHWCGFLQKMSKVTNVDEVLACHSDFLDACLKDCMLTIPALLAVVTKLLSICVRFCTFMQHSQRYFVEAELGGSLPNSFYESFTQAEPVNNEGHVGNISFEGKIARFDEEFTVCIMSLLENINNLNRSDSDHDRLFNLLYRLNFNLFYSNQLTTHMGFSKLSHLSHDASG